MTRLVGGPRDGENVKLDPYRIPKLQMLNTKPGSIVKATAYCIYEYDWRSCTYGFTGTQSIEDPK